MLSQVNRRESAYAPDRGGDLFILLVLVPMEVLIAIVTIDPPAPRSIAQKVLWVFWPFGGGLLLGHRSSQVATEPAHPFGREFFGLLVGVLNVIASVAALLLLQKSK